MGDYINLPGEPHNTRNDAFSYLIAKVYMMVGRLSFEQILALHSMKEKWHGVWVCEALINL